MSMSPSVAPSPSKRRLTRLAILLVPALLAVLLSLPWIARQAIGPERLKILAEETLTSALGRRVRIHGAVSITPWLAVSVRDLSVDNTPEFAPTPLLEVAKTEISIRLVPLLGKIIALRSVHLRGVRLHARRNAAGHANWEGPLPPTGHPTPSASGWDVLLQPSNLRVADAAVDYADQASGRHWTVRDARLATGKGQPFAFTLFFRSSGLLQGTDLECQAQGRATIDPESLRLTVRHARVTAGLTFHEPLVPGGASLVGVSSQATVNYDSATDLLTLDDLTARIPGARLVGAVRVEHPLRAPRLDTQLTLTIDMAGDWREILGLTPGAPASLSSPPSADGDGEPAVAEHERLRPANPEAGQAVLHLAATADAKHLFLRNLRLSLPQGSATARADLLWGPVPALDLTLQASDIHFGVPPLPAGRDSWVLPTAWLSRIRLDARLDLKNCRLGRLSVQDLHATAKGLEGHGRLYPVAAVLPEGLVNLDARLDATRQDLGLAVQASLTPRDPSAETSTTQVRFQGRLAPSGAVGNLTLHSPNLQAAANRLGLTDAGLPESRLDVQSAIQVRPGTNQPIRRLELIDLVATLDATTLHGRLGWNIAAAPHLHFDLSTDTLDTTRLEALAGKKSGEALQAKGQLRADLVRLQGLDTRHAAANLTIDGERFTIGLLGGELFGGKLTGTINRDATGRIIAALALAGAEGHRLPGYLGLSGTLSAKADLDLRLARTGLPKALQAKVELTAAQFSQGTGTERLVLPNPQAALVLTGQSFPADGDTLPLEGSLTVTTPGTPHLRDVRLAVQGPFLVDRAGQLRKAATLKCTGSAQWRRKSASPLPVSLTGPITVAQDGGLTAKGLRLAVGKLVATATMSRKPEAAAPIHIALETGPVAPRQILADWGLSLPRHMAADRLTKASLSLTALAEEKGLDISSLRLGVDDSLLTGRVSLPRYDPHRARWHLHLDQLDWDAYFPPSDTSTPAERRQPLDLAWLRELTVDGTLAVGWFKKGHVTFDATTLVIHAKQGQFSYRQESPRFYGGRFFAEIRGEALAEGLRTTVELKLEGFECARFLHDWAEGETLESGGATFILASRTSGTSEAELRANLAGSAKFQITRGSLKVHDDSSHKSGEGSASDRLPFDLFSASWVARGGVAHTEDFLIDSPHMQVLGKGDVDLREETIDLNLTATLSKDSEVQATISGPLDNPKLTINRGKLIGDFMYRLIQGIISIPGKTLSHILQVR